MNLIPRCDGAESFEPSTPSESDENRRGAAFERRPDSGSTPMKRKSRVTAAAVVARRLDFNDCITPPRTPLGCITPPHTPPICNDPTRKLPCCIAPARKKPRRLFEEIGAVSVPRQLGTSAVRILEDFPAVRWNSRAMSDYFSNPAPKYMR